MRFIAIALLMTGTALALLPAVDRTPNLDLRRFVNALNSGAIIIDARGAQLFNAGHIAGAIDHSTNDFQRRLPSDPRTPMVVYCGGSAVNCEMWRPVAAQLREAGYRNVSHFGGGLHEWQQRGLPVTQGRQPQPAGLAYHDGMAYLIKPVDLPADQQPALLVWCHPGSGDPADEFAYLQQSPLFDGRDDRTVLLAPQAASRGWSVERDGPALERLIAHVITEHNIDPSQVVLGGHSSGGFFTYDWGLQHQSTFAALVVAAAYATRDIPRPDRRAAPPIQIYHSRNDQVIAWDRMQHTKQQLERRRYQVSLTEDDQQHNIGPKLLALLERQFTELAVEP